MDDKLPSTCALPVDRPPSEIFLSIFHLLPQTDLVNAVRVCRRWHFLAAPILWREPKLFLQSTRPASSIAVASNEPARLNTTPISTTPSSPLSSSPPSSTLPANIRGTSDGNSLHGHQGQVTNAAPSFEISAPLPRSPIASNDPTPVYARNSLNQETPTVQVILPDDTSSDTERESRRIFNLFKRKTHPHGLPSSSVSLSSSSLARCQDPQKETWHLFMQTTCGVDWYKRPSLSQQLISRCSALILRSFSSLGGNTVTSGHGGDDVSNNTMSMPYLHDNSEHPRELISTAEKRIAYAGATSFILSTDSPSSTNDSPVGLPVNTSTTSLATSQMASSVGSSFSDINLDEAPTNNPLVPPPLLYLGHYSALIERLNLSKGYLRVSDHAIRQLAEQCPKLRVINLSSCLQITDEAMIALAQHCPLEAVNATSCQQLTTATTLALAKYCYRLRSLCLAGCPLTINDETIRELVYGCGHKLGYLRIGGSFQLTDVGLISIAKGCNSQLRWLDVGQCPLISDKGVLALAANCPQLEWLDLTKGYPSQHQQYLQQFQQQQQRTVQMQQQWSQQQLQQQSATETPAPSTTIPSQSLPTTHPASALTTPMPQPEITAEIQQAALTIAHTASRFFSNRTGPLPVITDASICKLVERCPKLRLLNLNGRGELTDVTLDAVSIYCMNLRSLTISGCNKVTTSAVKRLGSDRIGWVGMSPCPNVSFTEVCAASKWKVISLQDVPKFHLNLMNGQSWDDVGTERSR